MAKKHTLPSLIHAARLRHGLSFDGWAALLGAHHATVRRWEAGQTVPTYQQLRALVLRGGIDPRELFSN